MPRLLDAEVPGAVPNGGIVHGREYRRSQSDHCGLRGHPVPSLLTHDPLRGQMSAFLV
jgi:hypothetical protein